MWRIWRLILCAATVQSVPEVYELPVNSHAAKSRSVVGYEAQEGGNEIESAVAAPSGFFGAATLPSRPPGWGQWPHAEQSGVYHQRAMGVQQQQVSRPENYIVIQDSLRGNPGGDGGVMQQGILPGQRQYTHTSVNVDVALPVQQQWQQYGSPPMHMSYTGDVSPEDALVANGVFGPTPIPLCTPGVRMKRLKKTTKARGLIVMQTLHYIATFPSGYRVEVPESEAFRCFSMDPQTQMMYQKVNVKAGFEHRRRRQRKLGKPRRMGGQRQQRAEALPKLKEAGDDDSWSSQKSQLHNGGDSPVGVPPGSITLEQLNDVRLRQATSIRKAKQMLGKNDRRQRVSPHAVGPSMKLLEEVDAGISAPHCGKDALLDTNVVSSRPAGAGQGGGPQRLAQEGAPEAAQGVVPSVSAGAARHTESSQSRKAPTLVNNVACWRFLFKKTAAHNFGWLVPPGECDVNSPYFEGITDSDVICTSRGGMEVWHLPFAFPESLPYKIGCMAKDVAQNTPADVCWRAVSTTPQLILKREASLEACAGLDHPFADRVHVAARFAPSEGGIPDIVKCNTPDITEVYVDVQTDHNGSTFHGRARCGLETEPSYACVGPGHRCMNYSFSKLANEA